MNEKNNHHWTSDPEKVEAFMLNRISEIERENLSAHLRECDECNLIVQQEREIISGIRSFGRIEMKQRLKQKIQSDQEKRFEWTQVASIAAAIILMFGIIFTIRWFTDLDRNNLRSREIVLKSDDPSQRSLWIIGKVVTQQRVFRGTLSRNNSSFIIKQGNATQTVHIHQTKCANLPSAMKDIDGSNIHTLLEQNSGGLNLTLFTDIATDSTAIGIEALTSDSLIVYLNGKQIAFYIPGGWAGRI